MDSSSLEVYGTFCELVEVVFITVSTERAPGKEMLNVPGLNDHIVKGELVTQSCLISVYAVFNIMATAVGPDVCVDWMRGDRHPGCVLFPADEDVVNFISHDFFLLTFPDGEAFVVDLTTAQSAGMIGFSRRRSTSILVWMVLTIWSLRLSTLSSRLVMHVKQQG